jgi:hypothetical protein
MPIRRGPRPTTECRQCGRSTPNTTIGLCHRCHAAERPAIEWDAVVSSLSGTHETRICEHCGGRFVLAHGGAVFGQHAFCPSCESWGTRAVVLPAVQDPPA